MKNFNNSLPKISIVVVTLNNERTLSECLKRILEQDYPKDRIEYINIDGGSSDQTMHIAKQFGFTCIKSSIPKNAEAQRAIGLERATNNLIVSIDADNYLPEKNWLRKMIKPFVDDSAIVHAGTLHYGYRPTDTIYNRYCALFGFVDPVVFYMGKPDRRPQYVKSWNLGKIVNESSAYTTVIFTKDDLPTVGCNGVVYRKDVLMKYARVTPNDFIHIDIFVDLIEKGYNKFVVVNTNLIHDTAVNLPTLIKKRMSFLTDYYMNESVDRRYYIYNPKSARDRLKLFLFILYTITLVKPIADSLRGYWAIHDAAWFLHPVLCWVYLLSYASASIKQKSSYT